MPPQHLEKPCKAPCLAFLSEVPRLQHHGPTSDGLHLLTASHLFQPEPSSPLHSASRHWRLCCPPSPCPLCSWILPMTPSSHHQSLCPAHTQKHAAWSCPGRLVLASPPLQGSQPHKQASLASYAFFLMFAIPQEHLSQIQRYLHLSRRCCKSCHVSLDSA